MTQRPAGEMRPPRDDVQICCSAFDAAIDWDAHALLLPADERERAAGFLDPGGRRWFVARRLFLRDVLGSVLQVPPAEIRFTTGPGGKPEVREPASEPALAFGTAHSEGLTVIAVAAARRVGIDVERIRDMPDAEGLVERFASPDERAAFRRLPPEVRLTAFFDWWTRKEACVKATGAGLGQPLEGFTVPFGPDAAGGGDPVRLPGSTAQWSVLSVTAADGFTCALCVEGPAPRIEYRRRPPAGYRPGA